MSGVSPLLQNNPNGNARRVQSSVRKPGGSQSRNQQNSQTTHSAKKQRGFSGIPRGASGLAIGGRAQTIHGAPLPEPAIMKSGILPQNESINSLPEQLVSQNIMKTQSRFRIALPPQQSQDVSGKYWNQISNQMNVDKNFLQYKLQSQRLAPAGSSSANLHEDGLASGRGIQSMLGHNATNQFLLQANRSKILLDQQPPQLYSDRDHHQRTLPTPSNAGTIQRNEFDQLQKPFQFLANVGGKETSQYQFTAKIDRSLLKPMPLDLKDGGQTDREKQNDQPSMIVFTKADVDKHDFDIRERRIMQRQASASQRPLTSTHKSSMKNIPSGLTLYKQQKQINLEQHQRPISGQIPQTLSHKILGNKLQKDQSQKQKDFKISKRPFSANPKYMKLAGMNRPFSAQLKMEGDPKQAHLESKEDLIDEDEDEDDYGDEYVDLNIYEVPEEDKFGGNTAGIDGKQETFSQRIMNSRPTTAYKKDRNFDLPFPELFDRSERTFAATFAKYGDLSYYTPIQRIGTYMDYSARLKKRHLLDLIAYMKTSKRPIKPQDEEQNEQEQAQKDYMENTLFLGLMPEEEEALVEALTQAEIMINQQDEGKVFDPTMIRYEGGFQYQKVWSETLQNQVQLSIQRFFKYIDSNDAIRNEEISKFKKDWMQHSLDMIPDTLLQSFQDEVRKLFGEVFQSYARAMKQAILEYILRSPDERKRLHILMLPRPVPTATEKSLLRGGYSTAKFAQSHTRKLETESEIKMRLLNNNVVISALQNWQQDFRGFSLIDFRNLYQFIDSDTGVSGTACYSLDIDNFFNLQEAYRDKVYHLMKNIWHRGCVLIIKKFKFLRLRMHQQMLEQGKASRGKWTFEGYKPRTDSERASVENCNELRWDRIDNFIPGAFGKQTLMQRYSARTAITHQNIHLNYFNTEQGMNFTDIPSEYFDQTEMNDLVDIRENSAYIAFVSMIGGYINFEENGYEILAKEYKRELKYSAGNLMRLHLREIVERSVRKLFNFFKGFVTVEKAKSLVSPLRQIRIMPTQERVKKPSNEEIEKKKREDDAKKTNNPKLAEQLARMKEAQLKRPSVMEQQQVSPFDEEPRLKLPDFFDFQDHFNPVLRLELTLVSGNLTASNAMSQSQSTAFQGVPLSTGDSLDFTKKEQDILDDFEHFYNRMISTFNDFIRPEFSKVKLVSKKRYESDLEEEARLKKLNLQIKKQTVGGAGKTQTSFVQSGANFNNQGNTSTSMFGGVHGNQKIKDFDQLLYRNHDDGSDVYRKYLGRIQIAESSRDTKELIDDNHMGAFAKPFVEKYMKVCNPDAEDFFMLIKKKIRKILQKHIKEAKRVNEIFLQFDPIIRGTLQMRVKDFISTGEDKREAEYQSLIKELRFYQKLSHQLPTIVFFPMFEVGTQLVKDEIQRRIKTLLSIVFRKFEQTLVIRSQGICEKYNQICKYLDKQLRTPYDVVDMDRYKNNLLLELGNMQERMYENRKSMFFLMHNDKMFEEETFALIKELHEWPSKLNHHMDVCDDRHRQERADIETFVLRKRDMFETNLAMLEDAIKEVGTWGDLYGYRMIINKVIDYQGQIDKYEEQMLEISQEEMMLFGFKSPFESFHRTKKFFTPFYELWTSVSEIMIKKRQWLESTLANIDPEEVDAMIKTSIKSLQKLAKHLQENQLAQKVIHSLSQEISDLNDWLPTIEVLCNPCLKPRHWSEIQRVANANFNYKEISLNEVKYFNIKDYLDQLAEISEKAKKENRLEKMLDKMENEWKDLRFELTTFRDTGIPILQGQNVEEIQLLLDEHTLNAQTIRSSPDVQPMYERAANWERMMIFLQEVLEVWIKVQANYLYLEPIFHSEDITKKLPQEALEFSIIDKMWRDVMNKVQQDNLVTHLIKIKNVQQNLEDSHVALERIQKSLNDYLETKRQYFPRFYFLSNEDLLEILGDSKKPHKVQKHLKKCFEGVNEVVFKPSGDDPDNEITGIVSREGEKVDLIKSIFPHEYRGNVEQWLLELEGQMKQSMQTVIALSMGDYTKKVRNDSKRDAWIRQWQGQVILTVSQIIWTQSIEKALNNEGTRGLLEYFKKCQIQLDEIVNLVRNDLPPLLRLTLGSLIVIDVHAKDVLEAMINDQVTNCDDFTWLAQLRYYFQPTAKHVLVKMITTVQDYGYEYLGNTGRLVITPLTDRCYRTLMSALHLNLGGAPEGPAGTGKTESTKDLAKAIAVHCMVFNCAEGLNAQAMAKFFKGLASAGSWSCFDEFNRIELEVLSVVAQQILEIQRAKNQGKELFRFEETDIVLKNSCNIFITMNPGYAGRSELPDNLKALFRPVAMMMPDYTMIAEISLYSFGFLESRNLAKKIVATYRLCSEQLSSQYHYDYGMRAVKAVLTAAKGLKQKYQEEREDVLILRSINDVNLPKFLAHDIPLFQGIIEDLFQGVKLNDINYGSLDKSIRKQIKDLGLQEIKTFIEKVFQLYEMINVRHGLMLVGPPFGAKTQSYRVLARAITQVSKDDPKFGEIPVDTYVINPKSITLQQLYGNFDPISHDFSDGILAQIFRKCAYQHVGKSRRWIVFDGPVDAEWIENMNTVLDDNKKLCLLNGEVIMMNDQMNLIFETHDLSQASPATVSRCGMVYMQPENVGWQALLQSWLDILKIKTKGAQGETLDPSLIRRIEDLFEIFFADCVNYLRKKCTTYVPVGEVQLASSLMKIYQSLLVNPSFLEMCYNPKIKNEDIVNRIDMYFLFALNWSVGAVADEAGQKNFSHMIRKMCTEIYRVRQNKTVKIDKNSQIPDGGQIVQNYFIEEQRWVCWKDVLDKNDASKEFDPSLTYHELIVPTTENLKNSYILNLYVKSLIPVLFVGPTGTGKSVLVQKYIRSLPYDNYQSVFITFSAKTTANQTQDIIDSKLEKRGRRVMGPPLGKKCVIFVDDLNMPALEKYGAQPPIELLRQWMDHRGWFEFKEKEKLFKELIDLGFVAAMGPPGGGKNPITPRYLRHFNLVSINNFDESVLQRIFTKLMDWHLKRANFSPTTDVFRSLQNVVFGSVDVFLYAQAELRPTPAKSHYLFNLRDLSRVIQGIQLAKRDELTDSRKVLRLWVHEIARVFGDRLVNEEDQDLLYARLFQSCREKVKDDLTGALKQIMDERKIRVEGNKEVMTRHLIFGDVLGDGISTHDRKYDEIQPNQKGLLSDRMNGYLEDYNSVSKKPMNLVLFDFAIMHVLRICRILKMAGGNAFLIGVGGSGRQSLSKLATFVCDYGIVETEQAKNYNIDSWKEDMKRLLILAGQDNKNSVFLLTDAQIKYPFMLEDVNNLLNSYEIPNLFPQDEKLQIIEKLRPQARKEGRLNLYNNGTNEQFNDYFVEKTRQHLHIILAMSPIGNSLRERIRNFPSLVNCCTFDWFTTWPEDALEAVAERFLGADGEIDNPSERQAIIQMCKKIHTDMIELSKTYLSEQKRHNYVTPTSYLELILTYKDLLRKSRNKLLSLKLGYDKGIEKLLFTADEVYKMQQDLNEKQPKLTQMTFETELLMEKIEKEQREVVAPKKVQIEEEEASANQMAQEAQTIKIECDNDLSKAMPLVKKAQEALNTIQPSHINEIKALGKPPDPIKKVLHAVCIMCQRKVEKTPMKDNPKMLEENWWYTSQKFMSEKNFLESLLEFDKDHIPDVVMNKIRTQFLNDPDFKPQRVEKASFAAKGLCMWIRALDQYDKVAKIIAPKRARAKEAETKYKETLHALRTKQAELRDIMEKFESLQFQLQEMKLKKQRLEEDIEDCARKLDRAQTLLHGLGGEQKRWEEESVNLGQQYECLIGDILVSSAIISYLGSFTSVYRNQTVYKWISEIKSLKINASTTYSLQQILGEPVTIRHWNMSGLPTDAFSVDNGLIVFNSRRWPLMIDPQGQANRWIKNLETGDNQKSGVRLQIVKLSDPDFVRVFEQSIQLGFPIVLENVGEELDPILEPLLMKQTFKSAGVVSINFGENVLEYSPDFRLYITTKHGNPHYLPELSTKVTLINFMITFDGLKDYLLNLVVQKENAALDEERSKLIVQTYENNKQLKGIENKILEVLRNSQGNILDDEKAINILKQSQEMSQHIKEKQEIAIVTEKKLDEARRSYLPISYHCSLLFFIIQKLSYVDVMYQYSLTWFIQLFMMAIENSEKSEFIEQRIESLKSYFTYSLYSNICRSLFEKHKLLFSFILTAKLRESERKISSNQYEFLISTQPGLDNPLNLENPASDWMSEAVWNKFCQLSTIDPEFAHLVKTFDQHREAWKLIFESNSPHREAFPAINDKNILDGQKFTLFHKLCLLKVLRPDKLNPAIKEYVVAEMGESFVNPPPFDLELSFNDSTFSTPLIFVLPGADPLQSLTAFAIAKKKLDTMKSISLGQDQGPKAEKAIEEAKLKGGWVLLQNCHLYPSWMPKLERICEGLDMKVHGGKEVAHPSFRLWLTSYPTNDFPVLILQNGIKMTNEPPKGLKANMIGSFKLEPISDSAFFNIHRDQATFKKMVYGLCMFHAILQERRNYGSLGWNIRYEFTVSDLQISVKQLQLFTNDYKDVPFKALRYLTSECNYGGRVTDDRDRRVLKALMEDFYNPRFLTEGQHAFGLDQYEIPHGNLHYNKYLELIMKMPLEEPPALFGFHPNANITKELKETSELCYDLLKMGEIEGVKNIAATHTKSDSISSLQATGLRSAPTLTKNKVESKFGDTLHRTPEQIIERICKDILAKLPQQLYDIESVQQKYPLIRENSMNTFLVQELTRFNNLLKTITSSLKNILLALKGEVLLSEQLEKVYNSLLLGDIPQMWLAQSYPSLKNVASYIKDLCLRLQTYTQWIANGSPNVFWISGFFFTQSFLTGVFQNYARRYKVEIDTLSYDFKFLDEDPTDYENEIYSNGKTPQHIALEDGALISGLYLEGARWNYEQGSLDESNPKVLFSKVPIIWLKPTRMAKSQTSGSEDYYECPVYKTAERRGTLSTTGHSTNFILNVNLPRGQFESSHWIKRGVAMICQLTN